MTNNIVAAILGLIAAALAALILSPIVYLVFYHFFEFHLPGEPTKSRWLNDAIIIVTVLGWILAASMAGGYICSKHSETKEDFSILLFLVFSFAILMLIYRLHFFDEWVAVIPVATFIIGACLGNLVWLKKRKKL
jgi:xanthine/uracil permease